MSRKIILLAVIGLVFDSAGAAELILVNKKSGAEISPLKAGVEFELEGEVYVVQERKTTSPKFTTPKEALDAYLACEKWEDRIPLVIDSERVGKLMAKYYSDEFTWPEFGKIDSEPKLKARKSKVYIFKVYDYDVGDLEYAVQETKAGYKVDWEEFQKIREQAEARKNKRRELAEARKYKVDDAEFVVRVTTKNSEKYDWTDIRLDVWNNSKAFIGMWAVEISFYDKDKEYLGETMLLGENLKPGKKMFETIEATDIKPAAIDTWDLKLARLTVESADMETLHTAAKYFKFREVKKKK